MEAHSILESAEVEVVAKAQRRRFATEYKVRILREADAAKSPGEIGAMLRREGLYSSHLSAWRAARDRGELGGQACKRGRKPRRHDDREKKIRDLERENRRFRQRAERAEALVEVQKKLSEVLGIELPEEPNER
jgi:transposase